MKKHLRAAERVGIIVMFITLLVSAGLYAAEETLPTPEEIIAKNIEAIGGINALKKIQNRKIVLSLKVVQTNMDRKQTIYQERPDKYYLLSVTGTMEKFETGSNDWIGWNIHSSFGIRLLEGEELSDILIQNIFDGPDGPDVHYKLLKTKGIEEVNGRACYKVVKAPEKGTVRSVYYDKKSYMIIKTMTVHTDSQGEFLYEHYFEEYQKTDNILFPYKTVVFLRGQKVSEKLIETIEHNIDIPDGVFDIPEEVKAIMDKKELKYLEAK